jgi:hypothetical protein
MDLPSEEPEEIIDQFLFESKQFCDHAPEVMIGTKWSLFIDWLLG